MELWMTEWETKDLGLSVRIRETLFSGRSQFQEIVVVDTEPFGRMLVLDGVFQTSIFDEFIYHEMISHVPLFTHPNPKQILIIGGGDGGTLREVTKHAAEHIEMVEIDGLVVDVARRYLPEIAAALLAMPSNVTLRIDDGIRHVKHTPGKYDVIIVDCSDPIGPGQGLFTSEFYQDVYGALKEDGLFVQQTESPFYHQELITRLYKDISALFPIVRPYLAQIPLYPGGTHSFTIGSKKYDPCLIDIKGLPDIGATRYWNRELQKSCFVLPNYVQDLLK